MKVSFLVAAAALAACDHECAAGDASITSLTVDPVSVAPGGTITVTVGTDNFTIGADHHGSAGNDCGGHVHVYLDSLDSDPIVMLESSPATVEISAGTPTGTHTLWVSLETHGHDEEPVRIASEATTLTVQ